jgi:hypothetical protein
MGVIMRDELRIAFVFLVASFVLGFVACIGWRSVDALAGMVAPQSQCSTELQLSKAYAKQLETLVDEKQPTVWDALAGK